MFIKKSIILLSLFIPALLIFNLSSCEDSPTESGNTNTVLSLEDVSCTEAWVKISANGLHLPNTIRIYKNDSLITALLLNTKDSLLYFDNLLPDKTYKIRARIKQYNQQSNELTFTTMDTTSHNFTWQTFTFGQHSSSVLYDVAIINENNIWAVGEIYMNDSLGNPDPHAYNAVHWDGCEWKVLRIRYYGSCSAVEFPPLVAIWAFSENNIVVTNGGSIGWFDGSSIILDCGVNPLLTGAINKIWGTSSEDLYVVGNGGNIAHYSGASSGWQKIESGTTSIINDVWGVIDPSNNQQVIYGAVSFVAQTGDQKILKIQNNKVDSLHWNTGRRVHSVWSQNNRYLYAAGGGIFENKRGYWNEITEVPLYYSRNIRGTDKNNIFVCGDFGLFAHFSGTSWKTYNKLYIQGIYYSLSAKNNIVITVGFNGSKAIIIKGTRN